MRPEAVLDVLTRVIFENFSKQLDISWCSTLLSNVADPWHKRVFLAFWVLMKIKHLPTILIVFSMLKYASWSGLRRFDECHFRKFLQTAWYVIWRFTLLSNAAHPWHKSVFRILSSDENKTPSNYSNCA